MCFPRHETPELEDRVALGRFAGQIFDRFARQLNETMLRDDAEIARIKNHVIESPIIYPDLCSRGISGNLNPAGSMVEADTSQIRELT